MKTQLLVSTAVAIVLSFAAPVAAAIYKDIGPLDTLGKVKARFPNAKFEKLNPAWAQEQDVMYKITGHGLSGAIIVKFEDSRPYFRKQAAEATDDEKKKMFDQFANEPDEEITVDWVRWIPDEPIPLQRFILKYGPFEGKGFADDDLEPYREWITQGLHVALTDDEKKVTRVDFTFTPAERCSAWKIEHNWVPPDLEESCRPRHRPIKTKKKSS